jgi:hypothetical protein
MMEAETVSEMWNTNATLTKLIARNDLIVYFRSKSFTHTIIV